MREALTKIWFEKLFLLQDGRTDISGMKGPFRDQRLKIGIKVNELFGVWTDVTFKDLTVGLLTLTLTNPNPHPDTNPQAAD